MFTKIRYSLKQVVLLIAFLLLPLQSNAQSTSHGNFLTDFFASLQYSGWYFNATAIGQVLPYGIQQPYNNAVIPAVDVSPLAGWGYGWITWFNNVVISMSINKRFYQIQQPSNDNHLTQNAGGVDFMLGYTVQRFDRVQITPTIEYGLVGLPTEQFSPNPFVHIGGSLGITYSIPFISKPLAEKNVWFDAGTILMMNIGYVQYFSALTGKAAQTAFIMRLRVGLGAERQPMQKLDSSN